MIEKLVKYGKQIMKIEGVSGLGQDENGLRVFLKTDAAKANVEKFFALLKSPLGVGVSYVTTGEFSAYGMKVNEAKISSDVALLWKNVTTGIIIKDVLVTLNGKDEQTLKLSDRLDQGAFRQGLCCSPA